MAEIYSFGYWVLRRRKALDLTREELARRVGCASETIKKIERDERRPSRQIAELLANALAVPPEEQTLFLQVARGERSVDRMSLAPQSLQTSLEESHNLPTRPTRLIGREHELETIEHLLANPDCRLLTLVGPGGIGKTHLALHLAERKVGAFLNGVWFVSLAPLQSVDHIVSAIASTIGLNFLDGGDLKAQFLSYLHSKELLLVLDNFEHLMDGATLVADLLKAAPEVTVLVTSRERLNLQDEFLFKMEGLAYPADDAPMSDHFGAVQLFVERAGRMHPKSAFSQADHAAIARICRLVEGMPLAVELAAAWTHLLSCQEIADEIEQGLRILAGSRRDVPERHSSVRAVFHQSWKLLSEEEQVVLRRLSVFRGGFTREAAEQVSEASLPILAMLADKSLLRLDQRLSDVQRYDLHELVRQYAGERLLESGEPRLLRERHLNYFSRLAEEAEPKLRGPAQIDWLNRLKAEHDNLRAALEQAAKTDTEAGLYLSGRLQDLWESLDMREGARWLTEFIERSESKDYPCARAKALLAQGWLLTWFQQLGSANSAGRECLTLFRACLDRQGEVDALHLLSFACVDEDGSAHALEYHEQALTLARSLGDKWRQAMALTYPLSQAGSGYRDHQRTLALGEEALSLFREVGDWHELTDLLGLMSWFCVLDGDIDVAQKYLDESTKLEARSSATMIWENAKTAKSWIALMRGDNEEARSLLEEIATRAEERGKRLEYLWARVRLGYVALREGKLKEAQRLFAESARDFQKDEMQSGVIFSLEGIAGLYVAVGKPKYGAQLIGWADATREKLGDPRPFIEQADIDKLMGECLAKMGESAFLDAYHKGKTIALEEAVAYVVGEVEV